MTDPAQSASMTDEHAKPAAGAPETDEQRADATVEAEVTETVDRTAELEAAVTDMRDRLLRSHAEMENLRRRTEREVQDAKRYAVSAFARDLLGVADNLRRALDAAASGGENADPTLAALAQGVELTERELLKTLEKNGVKKLDPKGKPFDPHHHEAVFEAPDPSVPAGTVVQVMQDGYVIGDRILRPAMVGVARGGPKAGASAAEPTPTTESLDRTV
ncbi:nucleotide exchange factor GrpE [Hansschlegelia quercus]|uniref:Protein GrpE n=1 Tax=Hansschlegelia quercus TaxID=2528245 RepID=A0A4Q9GA32_9HYPH|nr:nucleotide exchange factor GrpE [Hansschlegelia quercus]TBN47666.1 nucleotide exchange factor GrpE [Hansschlegelia quercus]